MFCCGFAVLNVNADQSCIVTCFVFSLDHLSCAGLPRAPVDPCSRESVLKVLKESRKREMEDEDRSFITEQKSKRRYRTEGGLWRDYNSASSPLALITVL